MHKTTVLIVEDEAIVAADLAGKLTQLGYEVVGAAAEGEEAVEMACSLKPAVVLMDIRLRGSMDGIEAAEAIRIRHCAPIIYLTAHSDPATLERAKLSEPFGYILKPFEERELATTIEMALYRHQSDEELRRAKEAAEAANRAKSQFLANMSHELRTPMTGVLGMLDIVLLGNLEVEQREYIETAHASARSLIRILNDILDITRIEAGKFSIEEKPFSPLKCMENMVRLFLPVAKSKGLELDIKVADDLPETLVGDQARLNQVLTNLAGNAVKFTEKGKVEIRVATGDKRPGGKRAVTFSVTDSGIGIPADKKEVIFQYFTQVDESHTRSYGGAGLGLAISKEIVERMGGTITFTSEEGRGSTFSCTIPFDEAEAEGDAGFASGKSATAGDAPDAEVITIRRLLVAEDEQVTRQVLGLMLKMAKYECVFVENGRKAVELWESGKFDLILMDVQMPLMNGFEATGAIREKERTRGGHIPIVAMTAHALKEDEERCLTAGMDAYVSKPIDFKTCLQVIGETLEQPA
jgi:signal transduction histidine kinase